MTKLTLDDLKDIEGLPLKETNLSDLLKKKGARRILLSITPNSGNKVIFPVDEEFAPYLDRLKDLGWHDIVLWENFGENRLRGLSKLGVVEIREIPTDAVYTTGPNYDSTKIVGIEKGFLFRKYEAFGEIK